MVPMGYSGALNRGKLIHEKNLKTKIPYQTRFKFRVVLTLAQPLLTNLFLLNKFNTVGQMGLLITIATVVFRHPTY